MPQIPRQFLQRPQMGSVGRRDRQIARTQPGVADQVNAVIAATRGLDMTPIGDALYKTGTVFERMERERVGAEDELKRMKQMSAARSVIINTTQKIHDAYAEIKTRNLSDPEEVRNAFHQRVQAVMDEDQALLDQIGPYAFEPYSHSITNTIVKLQPDLTAQAISNSRTMLESQLREQTDTVVQMVGSIDDDEEAERMMEMQFGAIMDESYGFMSEYDRMAYGKAAMTKFISSRFKKKWSDNPKGALAYLDAQSGLDPEVRHKMYSEVVSEANQFNNYLEGQQQLQERMTEKLETERFQQTEADLIEAIRTDNKEKVLEIYGASLREPTAMSASHNSRIMTMALGVLDGSDEQKGPSDQMATAMELLTNPSVPLHMFDSWLSTNRGSFNNKEYIDLREKAAARGSKEGEAALGTYKQILGRLEDRLFAQHPDMLNPKNLSKEEQDQLLLGNTGPIMERLRRDAKDKLASLERDVRMSVDAALYTNSPKGQNFENLQRLTNSIEDQHYRQYEASFKNPSVRPAPYGRGLEESVNLWMGGKRDLQDVLMDITNHAKNHRNADGKWDPAKDPVYVRAQEAIKQAKQPAVGAAGAREEQPEQKQPEQKPVHAGILPDLEPVGRMEPARTIGKRVDDSRFEELYQQVGIGAQSAAEESSGNPAIIGNEPDGTKSYGMFQINQVNMPEFLTFLKSQGGEKEARALGKAKAGSAEFGKAWQKVADSPEFSKYQQKYAEQEFYGPARDAFEQHFSVKAGNMPPAIQMALFSTGIQHGGAKKVIKMAADAIGEPRGASPKEILQAIYEARTQYVMRLTSLDDETKQNLAARYQREFQRGLKYL